MTTLQSLRLDPHLNPAQFTITDVIDDWNPTDFATTTLIRAKAADNEGSRITGMAAGNDGDVKVIINFSDVVDAGIIGFMHENTGSTAANRFMCPGEDDFFLAKNAAAICVYDGTLSRWVIIAQGGRHQQLTTQQLGFWPESTTEADLSGTVHDWEPVAYSLQNSHYTTGLGLGAGSLLWKDASLWRVATALSGLTLTGAATYNNDDSGGHSPLKILINVGSGTLTLKHNNTGSDVFNRFACPGDVDVVLQPGEMAILVSTSGRTWNVLACPRADGQYSTLGRVSAGALSLGWHDGITARGCITPTALPNSQTDDWNPTGFTTSARIRAVSGGGSCAIGGMAGSADGTPIGDVKVIHAFDGPIVFKHNSSSSADGRRLILPNGADITIPIFGSAVFVYDMNYWMCVAKAT